MKIVKTLLFVAVTVLFVSGVTGQTTFGLKGGVNIADITDNVYKPRISGHGGIFVNRSIGKHFFIQPELLFSGEGKQDVWDNAEQTWAINYIQLPLMLQYYPIPQLYVEAGPQVGLLISAKNKIKDASQTNIKTLISTVEYAIGTGLGVKITDRVVLYGRYNFGLNDVTSYDAIVHHSNVGQIGIAVHFRK